MQQRKRRQNSDVAKIETYNSIRDELQSQNAALLKERHAILQRIEQAPNSQGFGNPNLDHNKSYPQSTPYQEISPSKNNASKSIVDNLKYKIEEIINICQNYEQNSKQYGKLNEVVEAQKSVLTYLNYLANQLIATTKNMSSSRHKNSKKKKAKTNKTQSYEPHQLEGFRQSIGDQAMEMIEEIERKALLQIESLRCDKINLMKKLNTQIKTSNEQKRLRIVLQNQVRNMQSQLVIGSGSERQQNNYMQVVQQQNESNYDQTPPMINTVPQTQSRRQIQVQGAGQQQSQQQLQQQSQLSQQQSFRQQQPQRQLQPQQYVQHIQSHEQPQQSGQQDDYVNVNQRVPPNQPKNYSKFHPSTNDNVRVIASQSAIQPRQPNRPQKPLLSEQQIAQEMERLRYQNQQLKHSISGNPNESLQIKSQLKSQVSQLNSKIQQYEQLLMSSHRNYSNSDIQEYQNLLAQATAITQQGNRLLKTKKNPEYRTTSGSFGYQQQHQYAVKAPTVGQRQRTVQRSVQERATFDYSRPPLQTFSPMDKSYHSQNYKSGFSPTQYEDIIEKMKHATRD